MMQLTYSLTQADVLRGTLLQTNIRRRYLIAGATFALLMFVVQLAVRWDRLCAYGIMWHRIGYLAGLCLAGGAAFGVVMALLFRYLTLPRLCRRIYRDNPAFFVDLKVKLDEEGLEVTSARQSTRTTWSDIRGVQENADVIVLRYSKTYGHVIPKRALTTETERQLRELLRAHLPTAL